VCFVSTISYGLENVERLYDVDDSLLLDPADEATDPPGDAKYDPTGWSPRLEEEAQ